MKSFLLVILILLILRCVGLFIKIAKSEDVEDRIVFSIGLVLDVLLIVWGFSIFPA